MIAIGGVTVARVAGLRAAGAYGVAVVGAVSGAADPACAATVPTSSATSLPRAAVIRAGRRSVVGGGVIGLAIAWRCRQRGLDVTVYDAGGDRAVRTSRPACSRRPRRPAGEDGSGPAARSSRCRRWPAFAAELAAETGVDLGYRDDGTLLVALTDDDLREVRRQVGWYQRAGQPVEPLTGAELREREPLLSPRVRGGGYAPGDHQVDPRRLLRTHCATGAGPAGADHRPVRRGRRPDDRRRRTGTRALTGLPVRPVKGQTVRLRGAPSRWSGT